MINFIYGPDAYRIKQKVLELSTSFLNNSGQAAIYDASDPHSLELLDQALRRQSLFDPRQCSVINNGWNKKAQAQELGKLLAATAIHADTNHLVIVIAQDDKIKSPAKAEAIAVRALTRSSAISWIQKECAVRQCQITPEAIGNLIQAVGLDSWALVNELDKLSNYRNQITEKDVAALTRFSSEQNIFAFTNALSQTKKTQALELLYRQLASGADPYYLFSMIIYKYRTMLSAKDSPELKKSYARLAALDLDVKQGNVQLIDQLYTFVLQN